MITFPSNSLKYVGRSINNWVFESLFWLGFFLLQGQEIQRNWFFMRILYGPSHWCWGQGTGPGLRYKDEDRICCRDTLFLWLLSFPLLLPLPVSSLSGSAAGSLAHSLGHVGPHVQLLGAPYYHFCCCKETDSLHSKSRITREEEDCPGWGQMFTLDISAAVRGQPHCAWLLYGSCVCLCGVCSVCVCVCEWCVVCVGVCSVCVACVCGVCTGVCSVCARMCVRARVWCVVCVCMCMCSVCVACVRVACVVCVWCVHRNV